MYIILLWLLCFNTMYYYGVKTNIWLASITYNNAY